MSKAKKRSTRQQDEQLHTQAGQRVRTQRRSSRQRKNKRAWGLVGGLLAIVFCIVGLFVFLATQQAGQLQNGQEKAVAAITSIDSATFAKVDQGDAQNQLHPLKNTPTLKGADGKPVFLYMGAEFCPYCAAQRWAVIAALSRFGQFHGLTPLLSGEGNIPTFTFHNSSYSSSYLDVQTVEIGDNHFPQTQPLDSLTSQQQQIFDQYNRPPYVDSTGNIPFIDIANQFISVGAYYPSDVLNGHSYQEIEAQLKDPTSPICRAVVGAANCLTTAICSATGNQPAGVCQTALMPALRQTQLQSTQSLAQSPQENSMASFAPLTWFRVKNKR